MTEELEKEIREAIREAGPIYEITLAVDLIKAMIEKRERVAWEAAREEVEDPNYDHSDDGWCYKYGPIDDWKKEQEGKVDHAKDEAEHLAKIKRIVEGAE